MIKRLGSGKMSKTIFHTGMCELLNDIYEECRTIREVEFITECICEISNKMKEEMIEELNNKGVLLDEKYKME